MQFLRRTKTTFLPVYVFNAHSPFQGPNDKGPEPVSSEDMGRGSQAKYTEMVERLDDRIGTILKTLDETGRPPIRWSCSRAIAAGRCTPATNHFLAVRGRPMKKRNSRALHPPLSGKLAAGSESSQVTMTVDLTASILNLAGAKPLPNLPSTASTLSSLRAESPKSFAPSSGDNGGERSPGGVRGRLEAGLKQDGSQRQDWLFDLAKDREEKTRPRRLASCGHEAAARDCWENGKARSSPPGS